MTLSRGPWGPVLPLLDPKEAFALALDKTVAFQERRIDAGEEWAAWDLLHRLLLHRRASNLGVLASTGEEK